MGKNPNLSMISGYFRPLEQFKAFFWDKKEFVKGKRTYNWERDKCNTRSKLEGFPFKLKNRGKRGIPWKYVLVD